MELVVYCENWFDQSRLVYELVGDDFSFTFDAKTGKVHIPVKSKEEAQEEVSRRLPLYDLEEAYICEYIEEGKEPEELTAY